MADPRTAKKLAEQAAAKKAAKAVQGHEAVREGRGKHRRGAQVRHSQGGPALG